MEEIDGCRRWEVGGDWEDRGDGACVLDDGSPVVYTKLITLMRKVWEWICPIPPRQREPVSPLVHCIWKWPPGNLL